MSCTNILPPDHYQCRHIFPEGDGCGSPRMVLLGAAEVDVIIGDAHEDLIEGLPGGF